MMQTAHMEYGDESYVKTSLVILKSKDLTPTDKLIYQIIKSHDHRGSGTFVGEKTIADEANVCVKQVRISTAKLVSKGLLIRERDDTKKGKPWSYSLPDIPAGFAGDKPIRLPENLSREQPQAIEQQQTEQTAQVDNPLNHPAIKVFKEVTGYYPSRQVEGLREAIINTVTDLGRWRRVLEHCKQKGYKVFQNKRIIRAYQEGWGIQANGTQRPSAPKMSTEEYNSQRIENDPVELKKLQRRMAQRSQATGGPMPQKGKPSEGNRGLSSGHNV